MQQIIANFKCNVCDILVEPYQFYKLTDNTFMSNKKLEDRSPVLSTEQASYYMQLIGIPIVWSNWADLRQALWVLCWLPTQLNP